MLLAPKTAQHLEGHLHAVAEPLAALRLHADRNLLGQLDFGRVFVVLADHLRCDNSEHGFCGKWLEFLFYLSGYPI